MIHVGLCKERYNYYRLQSLEEAVENKVLNKLMDKYVKNSRFNNLTTFLDINRHHLLSRCKTNKLTKCKCGQTISVKCNRPMEKHQWDALFNSNDQSQCGFSARTDLNLTDDKFDVSLCSLLILKLKMFDSHLSDRDWKIAVDAVQQIRKKRNILHHKKKKKIETGKFFDIWRQTSDSILTLSTLISNEFREKMQRKVDKILLIKTKKDSFLVSPFACKMISVLISVLVGAACFAIIPSLFKRTGNVVESKNCTLFEKEEEVTGGNQIIAVFGEAQGLVSNHLVGEKRFRSGQAGPVNSATYVSTTALGERILVINMPSLIDTTPQNTVSEIVKCNEITSLGVDLILYAVEISRYSREESKALEDILQAYGKEVEEYIMIVFVGSERLQSHGTTLPEFIETFDDSSTLKKFFKKTDNHLIFPSTDDYAEEPVRFILKEIKTKGLPPLSLRWPVHSLGTKMSSEEEDSNDTKMPKRDRQAVEKAMSNSGDLVVHGNTCRRPGY